MHRQLLTTFPSIARNRGVADVDHLLDNVQLTKPVGRVGITGQIRQTFLMFLSHVLQVTQPIVAQAKSVAPKSGPHAAAAIMSGDDDMANFQDIHCKLQDRQTVEVCMDDQIGHISVDEQLSGQ